MGSKKNRKKILKKTRRPGARRRSTRNPPPPLVPPCVAGMGCLCAGHARNPNPETPCDAVEREHGVCCTVCGSMDVEYACWVNPNTNEVGEAFGSWNAGDNTFCPQCDMNGRDPNPSLVDASELDKFLNARSKRLGDSRGGKYIPPKYDAEGQRIDEHGHPIENDEGEW